MFDTYMEAHSIDPGARRRMTMALGAAAVLSCTLVVSYAAAQRLGIARVIAPKVEIDFLFATATPPPVSAPPPELRVAIVERSAADPEPDPTPRREVEPDVAPIEDPSERPRSTATSTGTDKGTGVPGPAGVPGFPGGTSKLPCIPGACTIGTPPMVPPRTTPDDGPAKLPISVATARAKFSPDPPREALAQTRAGVAGRGGTTVVAFCVGIDGKVDEVATKRSAGDVDVDRICRDTIRRWRFTPYEVGGRSKRMCSETTFVIEFD